MADKEVDEQAEQASTQNQGRRRMMLMVGVLVAVMVIEGLAVVVLVKSFSPPPAAADAAQVAGLDPLAGEKEPEQVEVEIVRFRAQNEKSPRPVIYEFVVFASVSEADGEEFRLLVERKNATIQDRLSSVVRAADPERFTEPDLATLRQQFKHELGQIAGDEEMVQEVLIPSIVPFTGY